MRGKLVVPLGISIKLSGFLDGAFRKLGVTPTTDRLADVNMHGFTKPQH